MAAGLAHPGRQARVVGESGSDDCRRDRAALDARMLSDAQRGVFRGMAIAMAISAAALLAALLAPPAFLLPSGGFPETLRAALAWDVLVVACLAAAIANLARHRFFSPADIDGSGLTPGTERAHVFQAVLQNTLEQAVLAVGVHAIWAAAMPLAWQAAVPVAAVLFGAGRLRFARGYAAGAPARALGFGLTFYPSVLMLVALLLRALF